MIIGHTIIRHAAHYSGMRNAGHDLEQWVVSGVSRDAILPTLPRDAEYHSGFCENGEQRWVYVRTRPLSPGRCDSPVCNCDVEPNQ